MSHTSCQNVYFFPGIFFITLRIVSSLPMCGFYSEPLVVCFFGTEQNLSHILEQGWLTAVVLFFLNTLTIVVSDVLPALR